MRIIWFILILLSINSCSKNLSETQLIEDKPKILGEQNTIDRAKVLAGLSFVPLDDLECNLGNIYKKSEIAYGVPYSSVKEIQTYVGQDVSLYTFITAVNNPYSLLYTEKLDSLPYHGKNCKLYYGTVCSVAVMTALGITIPYTTAIFQDSGLFVKCEKQSPDDIQLCSILLEPGHMSMVVGISRDYDGNIVFVDVFEAIQAGTVIRRFSYSEFCERWKKNNIERYEYKYIAQNVSPFDIIENSHIYRSSVFPQLLEICPNKGDKSSYTTEEDIIINIIEQKYEKIELYRFNDMISEQNISSLSKVTYSGLTPGEYKVRMKKDSAYSHSTFFEVIDISTDITFDNELIYISPCSNNAMPVFISFNVIPSGRYIKIFPFHDNFEHTSVPYSKQEDLPMYVRVVYKGKYGRVMFQKKVI